MAEVVDLTASPVREAQPNPALIDTIPASQPVRRPQRRLLSTAEAKKEFFLTPDDLMRLRDRGQFESWGGGIGCGAPMKMYYFPAVMEMAIAKFGQAGFRAKRLKLEEREAKKHAKEHEARASAERLAAARAAGTVATVDTKQLRAGILRLMKKSMHFLPSGSPGECRAEVPCVAPAAFADLAGHPGDSDLKTFVKSGGVYKVTIELERVFRCAGDETCLERHFGREGVSQRMCGHALLSYRPTTQTLLVRAGAEIR